MTRAAELYALSGWDGPGDAGRLHGAHGQLAVFASDAVVTVTAHDHGSADTAAEFIGNIAAK